MKSNNHFEIMTIITNLGFERKNAKVLISKNGQQATVCPKGTNCYDIDVEENDKIDIKLKCLDGSILPIASFIVQKGKRTYYVCPSTLYNRWSNLSYKYLPYLCIFFLVLQAAIPSERYKWFCTGVLLFTVLSLLALQISQLVPHIQTKFFKIEII